MTTQPPMTATEIEARQQGVSRLWAEARLAWLKSVVDALSKAEGESSKEP